MICLIIPLGPQSPNSLEVSTPPLPVPFVPGPMMPLNSVSSLEVTNGVLNHQASVQSNPVVYPKTAVGIQNFANHTPCVVE